MYTGKLYLQNYALHIENPIKMTIDFVGAVSGAIVGGILGGYMGGTYSEKLATNLINKIYKK